VPLPEQAKKGADEPADHALGRIRGGLTTKTQMVSDARGIPLHFTLSGGNASDISRLFDKPKYRQRNAIERLFGWLKEHRRLCTRYCKLAESFAAMVTLACWRRCLRLYFSYSA